MGSSTGNVEPRPGGIGSYIGPAPPRVHLKQASNELIAYGLVGIDLTLRLSSLNAATSSNVTSTASPVTSTASPTSSTHPMSAAPSRRSFTRSSAAIHLLPDVFREEECRCRNAETSSRPPLRIARVPATSRSQEMSHGPLVAERPGCRRANGVAPKGSEAEKPPCGVPKGTAILKGHTGVECCAFSRRGLKNVRRDGKQRQDGAALECRSLKFAGFMLQ